MIIADGTCRFGRDTEEGRKFLEKGCGCGFVAHDEQGYVLPPRNPLQSQASRRRSPPGGGNFYGP